MSNVKIFHNPACGTSRNTLGLIHNAGIEPHVIEYLKTPPSRRLLHQPLWLMNSPCCRGSKSSTASEGRQSLTPLGVTTRGRLIRIG